MCSIEKAVVRKEKIKNDGKGRKVGRERRKGSRKGRMI